MEPKYIVAIEIGSSKIKGAVGSLGHNNRLTVESVEEEKLTGDEMADTVRYGIIQNVDKAANAVERIINSLQQTAGLPPRTISSVYVALGARSMYASKVEVTRDYPDEIEISAGFIEQLKEEARSRILNDQEIVAITPKAYTVDNKKASINPVGMFGCAIKATYMVVSIKPSVSRNIKRVITERCGRDINGYVVRPLAEAAFVLNDEERRLGCMLVDFGAETLTTTIYKGGVMQYLAVLPLGSRNITRDLMTLNYTEERAENLKCTIGNVESDEGLNKSRMAESQGGNELNEVIDARSREIIANILEQINYAGLQADQLPAGIVLVGGGSRLRGFAQLLKQLSKMNVRIGTQQELVRITDARLQASEAMDILAVLTDVAKHDPRECTVNPEPFKEDLFETQGDADYIPEASDADGEDESASRIGADVEDLFPSRNKKKEKEPKAPKPPKVKENPVNFVDDIDDMGEEEEENESNITRKLFNNISNRVKRLLTDPEDDYSSNN